MATRCCSVTCCATRRQWSSTSLRGTKGCALIFAHLLDPSTALRCCAVRVRRSALAACNGHTRQRCAGVHLDGQQWLHRMHRAVRRARQRDGHLCRGGHQASLRPRVRHGVKGGRRYQWWSRRRRGSGRCSGSNGDALAALICSLLPIRRDALSRARLPASHTGCAKLHGLAYVGIRPSRHTARCVRRIPKVACELISAPLQVCPSKSQVENSFSALSAHLQSLQQQAGMTHCNPPT